MEERDEIKNTQNRTRFEQHNFTNVTLKRVESSNTTKNWNVYR